MQVKRQFAFEWRTTLLTVLLLPAMISLGFWQLRRADENRGLIRAAEIQRELSPVGLTQLPLERAGSDILGRQTGFWQYRPVILHGQWQPEVFLLENQTHEGHNGYHIFGVMKLAAGWRVLVNRGWVAAPVLRSELPVFPAAQAGVDEVGEIYISPQMEVDEPLFAEAGWPRRIGRLHIPGLARETGSELLPFVVRLQEGSPSALTVHWSVVNILPEKNLGYAIQWFGMSIALVICYLFFAFRPVVMEPVSDEVDHG